MCIRDSLKIADGAEVRENEFDGFFVANIDASRGSTGSPVLDAETMLVEGILVRGDDELVLQDGCWASQRCGDNNCRGEDVTRSSEFQHLVPPDRESVIYEVWLGPCGNLAKVGETRATSWEIRERLEGATPYCWRIVARNECGRRDSTSLFGLMSTGLHCV